MSKFVLIADSTQLSAFGDCPEQVEKVRIDIGTIGRPVFVILDKEDVDRVSNLNWYVDGYPNSVVIRTHYAGITTSIGQFLLEYNGSLQIDHKDGDPFNNSKKNLRKANAQQQARNTGPRGFNEFKGVSYKKHAKKWHARLTLDGKEIFLGYHKTAEEAAKAYDNGAKMYFGEFARLNFPNE